MAQPLSVPYHPQKGEGDCLAACAQMVLAYFDIIRSQEQLARQLQVRPALGAPAPNIRRLASQQLDVDYGEGTLEQIADWLARSIPVIVFVQAGELPRWREERFQHAVVIVGLTEDSIWLLDPEGDPQPEAVPVEAFLLAWSGMDYLHAVVRRA